MARTSSQCATVFELYLSEDIEALIEKSEYKVPPSTSYQRCLNSMSELQKQMIKARKQKDEEMEFYFLHRYFNFITYLSKEQKNLKNNNNSNKNDKKFSGHNESERANENLKRYEKLKLILTKRYEARKEAIKAETLLKAQQEKEDESKNLDRRIASSGIVTRFTSESGVIQCNQLYSLILNAARKELLLILDVRPEKDFKASHINYDQIINIPEEILKSGLSANNLGKQLTGQSSELWNKRGDADILVLMDWSTFKSSSRESSPVFRLMNIIKLWDPLTTYKSIPVLLDGGYEEVLERYPKICTNPKVQIPRPPAISGSDLISNLDYPIEELEPERPKPSQVVSEVPTTPVVVDRSTKPVSQTKLCDKNIDDLIDELADSLNESTSDNTTTDQHDPNVYSSSKTFEHVGLMDVAPTPSSVNPSKPDPALVENLRKSKPTIVNDNSLPRDSASEGRSSGNGLTHNEPNKIRSADWKNDNDISREPLKTGGSSGGGILRRTSSSPNITKIGDDEPLHIPTFSRANKPLTSKKNNFLYNERTDATYGNTKT